MTERFDLLEQLGRGGMGTVWKARSSASGEVVALKLLHSIYVDDPDYLERFAREVEIAQRIDSPHVVKVLGFGQQDGVPYVAMEYVDGLSLRERLKASGPVPWDEAKRIATQTAMALSAAHAAGVIHRDIKPSNVLLDSTGQVKLADFGIARANDLTRMTGSVTVLGTPAYMSPDGDASVQSDLYGLGCVMFELLTGSPPFEGESQQQVLLKHIRQAPELDRLPSSARKVVGWLLEKDPRRRPQSADALLAVLTGSSIRGTGPVKVPSQRRARRWVGVGVLGVAVLGLVGGAAVAVAALLGGDDGEPTEPEDTPVALAAITNTPTPTLSATSTASASSAAPPTVGPETPTSTSTPQPTAGPGTPTFTPISSATGTVTAVATSTPTPVTPSATATLAATARPTTFATPHVDPVCARPPSFPIFTPQGLVVADSGGPTCSVWFEAFRQSCTTTFELGLSCTTGWFETSGLGSCDVAPCESAPFRARNQFGPGPSTTLLFR